MFECYGTCNAQMPIVSSSTRVPPPPLTLTLHHPTHTHEGYGDLLKLIYRVGSRGISHPWGWFPLPRISKACHRKLVLKCWNMSNFPSPKENQQLCMYTMYLPLPPRPPKAACTWILLVGSRVHVYTCTWAGIYWAGIVFSLRFQDISSSRMWAICTFMCTWYMYM